jgi:hypothetical protein
MLRFAQEQAKTLASSPTSPVDVEKDTEAAAPPSPAAAASSSSSTTSSSAPVGEEASKKTDKMVNEEPEMTEEPLKEEPMPPKEKIRRQPPDPPKPFWRLREVRGPSAPPPARRSRSRRKRESSSQQSPPKARPSRSRRLTLTEAPQASTGAAHESRRSPSPFQDSKPDVRDRVPRSPSSSPPLYRHLADVRDRKDTVVTIRCPICQHVLKGHANGAALKEHQANSSKCLRAQGKIRIDKEPCQFCGKPIAANDRWARVQHSYYCNGQRGSKGSKDWSWWK